MQNQIEQDTIIDISSAICEAFNILNCNFDVAIFKLCFESILINFDEKINQNVIIYSRYGLAFTIAKNCILNIKQNLSGGN